MEPAIHDLVRDLEPRSQPRPRAPEVEDVELEVVDDLLLDPWFFKSEEEIAAIEDDPTARIIEIKIGGYGTEATELDDSRWGL